MWMTSLAAVLKELALEDTTGAWAKQARPTAMWPVLNEELRAKRQERPSARAVTAHLGPQGPLTPMQPPMTAAGTDTVCFNCGGCGHIARMCPCKAQGGQVQQVRPQTLWVRNNQAFDMNTPPPAPCNRCGQMHWARFPCLQPKQGAAATANAHQPGGSNTQAVDWSAALLHMF